MNNIVKVINLGIPYPGEIIFESIDTPELIKSLEVSQTWKEVAENVLIKRWKGKMFEARQNRETKVVELLLERFYPEEIWLNMNIQDTCGWTSFMKTCYYGRKDVVKLLLDHHPERIQVNARDKNWEQTAVMWACENGNKDIVKLLLDHSDSENIDFNARDRVGNTGFMFACKKGHKKVVKLLLDHSDSKKPKTKKWFRWFTNLNSEKQR